MTLWLRSILKEKLKKTHPKYFSICTLSIENLPSEAERDYNCLLHTRSYSALIMSISVDQPALLAEQQENIITGLDSECFGPFMSNSTETHSSCVVMGNMWQGQHARPWALSLNGHELQASVSGCKWQWEKKTALLGDNMRACLEKQSYGHKFLLQARGYTVQVWVCWLLYKECLPVFWGSNRITVVLGWKK